MDENAFRTMFEAQVASPAIRDAWRDAYGNDFPEDADPDSFVTRTDLRRIVEALDLGSNDDLVDVGCGPGGPGAHVARASGARLTGIDATKNEAGAFQVFAGILARRERLERELGEGVAPLLFAWATLRPPELPESRRVFVSARRP